MLRDQPIWRQRSRGSRGIHLYVPAGRRDPGRSVRVSQIELVNYSIISLVAVGDPPMAVENSVYTATTSATGEFVFYTPPALLPTEHYYLRYTNPTLAGPPEDYDVTRVSSWTSYDLPEYAYDMNVAFPDINVANVEMNQNAGSVPVPYQFSLTGGFFGWYRRRRSSVGRRSSDFPALDRHQVWTLPPWT